MNQIKILSLALLMVVFSACSLRSELQEPKTEYKSDDANVSIKKNWWVDFNDPLLTKLIEDGFKNNSDLKLSFIKHKQAVQQLVIDASALAPYVDLKASGNRSQASRNADFTDTFSLGLSLQYELDFWGKNINTTRAAWSSYKASAYELENYKLLLAANISKLYFNSIKLAKQVKILEESKLAYQRTYNIKKEQFKMGSIGEYELYQNETLLDNVKIRLENTKKEMDANTNTLVTLTTDNLNDILYKKIDQKVLQAYEMTLPKEVPANILIARADVRAGLRRLEEANFMHGAARANYLPSISLSALLGFGSSQWGGITDAKNRQRGVGASFLMPLLHFGEINANVNLAKLAEQSAFISYEQTIKNALSQIRTALRSKKNAVVNRANYERYYLAKKKVFSLLQDKYDTGSASLIDLLNAKNDLLDARISFSNSKLDLAVANVELIQAFGGGFSEKTAKAELKQIEDDIEPSLIPN